MTEIKQQSQGISMSNQALNSNIILSMLVQSARELGFAVDQLIAKLPHGVSEDGNEQTRYPAASVPLIWQWLSQQSIEQNVGFRLAQQVSLTSQTMLTFLLMSSETLGDGLEKIIKYQHLLSEDTQYRIEHTANECCFIFQNNSDPSLKIAQQNEYFALLVHQWLFSLLGQSWSINRIEFSHPQPQDIIEHHALLQCQLAFNAPTNRLFFDASLLELAIPFANTRMNQVHIQHAEHLIAQLQKSKLVNLVLSLIGSNLANGDIYIDDIAKQCRLSERQLKAKLAAQGTSFTELLDKSRREQAAMLLTTTNNKIVDIGNTCGFSEPSAFNRAFKRWFAQTPSAYRRQSQ